MRLGTLYLYSNHKWTGPAELAVAQVRAVYLDVLGDDA